MTCDCTHISSIQQVSLYRTEYRLYVDEQMVWFNYKFEPCMLSWWHCHQRFRWLETSVLVYSFENNGQENASCISLAFKQTTNPYEPIPIYCPLDHEDVNIRPSNKSMNIYSQENVIHNSFHTCGSFYHVFKNQLHCPWWYCNIHIQF